MLQLQDTAFYKREVKTVGNLKVLGIHICSSQMIYQSIMDFDLNLAITLRGIHLHQDNLRKILLEAIEESLSSLGDSPKQAIFFHLEKSFKIKKDSIPANLTEFAKALEKVFGPGAFYLEKLIVKRLYEKLELEFEESEEWNLLEYVNNVKKRLPLKMQA